MTTARQAVVKLLTKQADGLRRIAPEPVDVSGLSDGQGRLAVAIHEMAMRRWITLEHLLNIWLRQPIKAVEPALRAVLAAGAAQLVFMERQAVHAVVDESVEMAGRMIRPGAGKIVNAVLRKVAGMVVERSPDQAWRPAADQLPGFEGTLKLAEPWLPEVSKFARHLCIATSHPTPLAAAWIERYGPVQAQAMLLHSLKRPPTIVWGGGAEQGEHLLPHKTPGLAIWKGGHTELSQWLAADPNRRVQDPTSGEAVLATAGLPVKRILDYCAGRGTKTRQFAMLHPGASVIGTDIDGAKLRQLRTSCGSLANVRAVEYGQMGPVRGSCDLLALDVPCSNTGVLARRIEAKYRYNDESLEELATLQRQIISEAWTMLAPTGPVYVLYSTCSTERQENEGQVRRMLTANRDFKLVLERQIAPGGETETDYHDGGYYALLHRPGA